MSETVHGVCTFLDQFAPLRTAESWDNVGLLLGDASREIDSLMTCLTLTPDVAAEAIKNKVGLIVAHHPILFRAVQRLTTDTTEGRMLLELAENRIAVYSPHTAFDSATGGINQQWCELLNLQQTQSLRPFDEEKAELSTGAGRCGDLPNPVSLSQLIQQVKGVCSLNHLQYVGNCDSEIRRVGVACGAAAEFMNEAALLDCDVLITGEARFHACLEARTKNISLIIVGHYASERFACEQLANALQTEFPKLTTRASEIESDPVNFG
ncbi:MAG: Nif3-like dinuclear metal center hexameric protein [Planctomycetaceae bacterium]|nr:Nif3-like dinuclear metal center hexameric protein [Planctomycetaceae bacterium]